MISALEYFKAKKRMTNSCSIDCTRCGLGVLNNGEGRNCRHFEIISSEKSIEIVENWAKENPVKTYKDVILEKLPNVEQDENRIPTMCLCRLFSVKACDVCSGNCIDHWNKPYEEDNNG